MLAWVFLVVGVGRFYFGIEDSLLILGLSAVVLIGFVVDGAAARIFLCVLFLAPLLMVTPQADPINRNYVAYVAVLGVLASLRGLPYAHGRLFDWPTCFLAWFCVSGVSTILTVGVSRYQVLVIPLLSLVTYSVVRSMSAEDDARWFLNLFLAFVLLQSVLGILQSLTSWPVFSLATETLFTGPRNYVAYLFPRVTPTVTQASGTYSQFNGLGGLLSLAVPFLLVRTRSNGYSFRTLAPFAVASVALVLTYSRGALFGAYIGLLIVLVGSGARAGTRIARLLFTTTATLLGAALFYAAIAQYVSETGNFTIRQSTWVASATYALHHPLRLIPGFGLSYFSENVIGATGTAARLHNGPLAVLLESGVVGLALFVMAIRTGLMSRPVRAKELALGLKGGMAAFLVHQLFDNSFFDVNGVFFWGFVAVLIGSSATGAREEEGPW